MKSCLTLEGLRAEARMFCEEASLENHLALLGVTDGKAVGTYIEKMFARRLADKYAVTIGSSGKGIDLPDEDIMTDIKATSLVQPQSSCPFLDARQKVYGLGYNILLFAYEKDDHAGRCSLRFGHCLFISKERTADFTLTKRLIEMLADGANKEDIAAFLHDRDLPGDEIVLGRLAGEILEKRPEQGYLTMSNALQWRLQYSRALSVGNTVDGIVNYQW